MAGVSEWDPESDIANHRVRFKNPDAHHDFRFSNVARRRSLSKARRLFSSRAKHFLESRWLSLTMLLLTFTSMFAMDIRTIILPKEVDPYIYGYMTFAIFMFALELALSTFVIEGYKYSFFWWLDFVSTISLATAIPWYSDWMIDECAAASSGMIVARAGRTARLARQGARALRVLRILRLLRIARVFKFMQSFVTQWVESKVNDRDNLHEDGDERSVNDIKRRAEASGLGQYLAYRSSRKIVYIVFILSIATPFLLEGPIKNEEDLGFSSFLLIAHDPSASEALAWESIGALGVHMEVLYLQAAGRVWVEKPVSHLRCQEIMKLIKDDDTIHISLRNQKVHESIMNICFVFLIVIVLYMSARMFSKDSSVLVVAPILRITDTVENIRCKLMSTVEQIELERKVTALTSHPPKSPTKPKPKLRHRSPRRGSTGALTSRVPGLSSLSGMLHHGHGHGLDQQDKEEEGGGGGRGSRGTHGLGRGRGI